MAFDQVSHKHDSRDELIKLSEEPFRDCKLWNRQQHDRERDRHDDRHKFLNDMLLHDDSPYARFGGTMHERTLLEDAVKHKLTVGQATALHRDIETFEQRARKQHIEPEAVESFYHQLNRVLGEKSTRELSGGQRAQLALEMAHNAAHPESVIQGQHNTCNVATVEFRLYSRVPDQAASVTTDLALHGKFHTADGTTVSLDAGSLKPDAEAKNNPENGTKRTYASQLLQLGAVNAHWQRENAVDGIRYSYRQAFDGKETLMISIDGRNSVYTDRDGEVHQPKLSLRNLTDIYNQLAKTNDTNIAAENINGMREKNVRLPESNDNDIFLRSPTDLHNMLTDAKAHHRFPIFLSVHTGNHPFDVQELRENPTLARVEGNFGWHAIAVYDYDERSHTARLHNPWGKKNDINVAVDMLYKSTLVPNEAAFMSNR